MPESTSDALNMPSDSLSPDQMLDELATLRDEILSLVRERDFTAMELIPAYLREQVRSENDRYDEKIDVRANKASQLESLIKAAVVREGHTIKGQRLEAIYSRGKDSWDSVGLLRYAKDHREVLDFLKTGNPYCLRIQVKWEFRE